MYVCMCTCVYTYVYMCMYVYIEVACECQGARAPVRAHTRMHGLRRQRALRCVACQSVRMAVLRTSGGFRCALVDVPWRGSVSARSAWGDIVSFNMLSKVLEMLSILRRQGTLYEGTPTTA